MTMKDPPPTDDASTAGARKNKFTLRNPFKEKPRITVDSNAKAIFTEPETSRSPSSTFTISKSPSSRIKRLMNGDADKTLQVLVLKPVEIVEGSRGAFTTTALGCLMREDREDFDDLMQIIDGWDKDKKKQALDVQDSAGKSALHVAAEESHLHEESYLHAVERLIDAGANIRAKDKTERTPLHWAAARHSRDIFNRLLQGATTGTISQPVLTKSDFLSKDNTGKTVLHIASANKKEEIADAILQKLDTFEPKDLGDILSAKDNRGWQPLMYAVQKNRTHNVCSLVLKLRKANISLSRTVDGDGKTALHWAAEFGYQSIILLMVAAALKKDFDPSPDAPSNIREELALLLKPERYDADVLMDYVNKRSKLGLSAFDSAITAMDPTKPNNHKRVLKELLKFGADPDNKGDDGLSSLQRATFSNSVDLVGEVQLAVRHREMVEECSDLGANQGPGSEQGPRESIGNIYRRRMLVFIEDLLSKSDADVYELTREPSEETIEQIERRIENFEGKAGALKQKAEVSAKMLENHSGSSEAYIQNTEISSLKIEASRFENDATQLKDDYARNKDQISRLKTEIPEIKAQIKRFLQTAEDQMRKAYARKQGQTEGTAPNRSTTDDAKEDFVQSSEAKVSIENPAQSVITESTQDSGQSRNQTTSQAQPGIGKGSQVEGSNEDQPYERAPPMDSLESVPEEADSTFVDRFKETPELKEESALNEEVEFKGAVSPKEDNFNSATGAEKDTNSRNFPRNSNTVSAQQERKVQQSIEAGETIGEDEIVLSVEDEPKTALPNR